MSQHVKSMKAWLELFGQADIPILRNTALELELLRANQGHLNASSIANVITDDPLMTVKVLRYMQVKKRHSQTYELVDVKQMLLMMGLDTFFQEIPAMPLAEELLQDHPDALVHLLQTVRRAQRAADYAFDWALRLHDLHAEEVYVSALLSHVSEMLMWCLNPESMLEIRKLQEAAPELRSFDAQKQVLGFTGAELQRHLTVDWKLPELLQNLMDPELSMSPRVRTVMLAVNLARHSAQDWQNAALPDDYRAIAGLLRMDMERVIALVKVDSIDPTAKLS